MSLLYRYWVTTCKISKFSRAELGTGGEISKTSAERGPNKLITNKNWSWEVKFYLFSPVFFEKENPEDGMEKSSSSDMSPIW